MNTNELAKAQGVKVFDTALPLQWYEDVHEQTGFWPQRLGFVWSYDVSEIWGAPHPLTPLATEVLREYVAITHGKPSGVKVVVVDMGGSSDVGPYQLREAIAYVAESREMYRRTSFWMVFVDCKICGGDASGIDGVRCPKCQERDEALSASKEIES